MVKKRNSTLRQEGVGYEGSPVHANSSTPEQYPLRVCPRFIRAPDASVLACETRQKKKKRGKFLCHIVKAWNVTASTVQALIVNISICCSEPHRPRVPRK